MGGFKDEVVLVTGGSRGVGRAIARLFAQEGARVIVNYKNGQTEAEETLSLLDGGPHFALQADISKAAEVRAMFHQIEKKCGRLGVLVNNAGVNRDARLESMTETMWDEVVTTNLKGAFLCAQSAAPLMMKDKRGVMINIASETALTGRAGACNYIAAKAGVVGLTKALARELAPSIRVNCIALGYTLTEELIERFNLDDADNLRRIEKEIPLGKIASPEEAARAVLFLSNQASSCVTGQVLAVGGGRWM
ncbi:MAG: beta-ketoacyl-ACP reductase [Candidatus Angelobacter sp. Gp1-AA117]|nr:MAG: beta-ketoacyl-ACP reductase [Candidatus Angelobacter sp. Gp1-AA117]